MIVGRPARIFHRDCARHELDDLYRYGVDEHRLEVVALGDFDVHHGNPGLVDGNYESVAHHAGERIVSCLEENMVCRHRDAAPPCM